MPDPQFSIFEASVKPEDRVTEQSRPKAVISERTGTFTASERSYKNV